VWLAWGLTDGLLVLAGVFLVAHLLADVRSMALAVHHPKDLLWTTATLVALVGHLILDYV
jgi:hypothetical protein